MSLLIAFLEEHRHCGDLDGGVQDERVLMLCECGAVLDRSQMNPPTPWSRAGRRGSEHRSKPSS